MFQNYFGDLVCYLSAVLERPNVVRQNLNQFFSIYVTDIGTGSEGRLEAAGNFSAQNLFP